MCEYCKDKRSIEELGGRGHLSFTHKYSNDIILARLNYNRDECGIKYSLDGAFPVNYCPMCGEPLTEEAKKKRYEKVIKWLKLQQAWAMREIEACGASAFGAVIVKLESGDL